jgi:hypothetical protein
MWAHVTAVAGVLPEVSGGHPAGPCACPGAPAGHVPPMWLRHLPPAILDQQCVPLPVQNAVTVLLSFRFDAAARTDIEYADVPLARSHCIGHSSEPYHQSFKY